MSRKAKAKKVGMTITSIISKVAGPYAFLSQITSKDMPTIMAQTTTTGQLKTIMNVVTGRISGFNAFKGGITQFPSTRNYGAIFNNQTLAGLAMILYGRAGKGTSWLPKAGYIGALGKKIAVASAAGGFFDAPAAGAPTQQYVAPLGYSNTFGTSTYSTPTGSTPVYNGGS